MRSLSRFARRVISPEDPLQYRAAFTRTVASHLMCSSIVWAAASASAQEQPSTQPSNETAPLRIEPLAPVDEDFQRGLDALKSGRDRDAVSAFETSYARDQNPAALLNIGIAHTNLGHPHAAVKALEAYVSRADATRDAASISAAKNEIERLRTESGRIGLHLVPADAKLALDGEPVEISGGELLASPGPHELSATAEGYKPFSQRLDVLPGRFTLEIQLQRSETSSAAIALAAAPVAAGPTPPVATSDEDETDDAASENCALRSVCVGPVANLLGPPNLIGGGVHARIGRYFGLGVDYQVLPRVTFSPISVTTSLVSANARVYPFGGAFFLSGGFGYQSLRGEVREGDISIRARAGFPAAMASVGFMGHDGFVLGADLGILFPLKTMRATLSEDAAVLTQNGISQADMDQARNDAESRVNKVLGAVPVLFQVNMIRLGYLF